MLVSFKTTKIKKYDSIITYLNTEFEKDKFYLTEVGINENNMQKIIKYKKKKKK